MAQKFYLVWEVPSGLIRRTGTCPEDDVASQAGAPDERVIAFSSMDGFVDHYMAERPTITAETIPNGSVFEAVETVTGETFAGVVDESGLEIDLPGSWRVSVAPPWPYKELVYETVVAG